MPTLKNLGIIEVPPKVDDYVAGIGSGVLYEERLPSGNWKQYRSTGEKQKEGSVDSMSCVSFSFNNAVECQVNWMIKEEKILSDKLDQLKPFLNTNGELDLSDMALAVESGTSENGNSLSWVAIVGRHTAVPQKEWEFDGSATTFAQLHRRILSTDKVKEWSDIFFSIFEIQTEWIQGTETEIRKHLKQAPIQIASATCSGWWGQEGTVVQACGMASNHATVIDGVTVSYYEDHDHYIPFGKRLDLKYQFSACLKIIVNLKKQPMATLTVKENHLYQLVEGTGGFALGLGGKLIIDELEKVIASFLVRNNGNISGKVVAVKLADWNSVPHINLKGEPV